MSEQHGSPISHRESAATLLARPWRVGHSTGRAIYAYPGDDDSVIGMMDTRELAAAVVNAHNQRVLLGGGYRAPTYDALCSMLGLPREAE